mgnify:CR=1 FL=1
MILAPHTDDGELGGGGTICKTFGRRKGSSLCSFLPLLKSTAKDLSIQYAGAGMPKSYIHSWHSSIKTDII